MLLGHSVSVSESPLHVGAIMCKVKRNGGPGSRYFYFLYLAQKGFLELEPDLSSSWI